MNCESNKRDLRTPDGVKVLSLFDGMACAMLALIEAGIGVSRYVAYEIDKYAVKTSAHNFPFIEHMGDVFGADFSQYHGFDLLMGGSPCFVAGTMVKTIDGIKPIEEIQIGDLVLTHKGRYMPVTRVMNRFTPETVIVKAENSGEIECTKEHPFYTREVLRKWNNDNRSNDRIPEKNFRWTDPEHFFKIKNSSGTVMRQTYLSSVCDDFRIPVEYNGIDINVNQFNTKHVQNLDLNNEHIWYVIGRWLGDGWFKYKYNAGKRLSGIIICCGKNEVDELEEKLQLSGLHYNVSEEYTTYRFTICNLELATYLFNFGIGAANKHLTKECYTLPDVLAQAFIKGYMDADGHIKDHICNFTTVSKELAYGIKFMVNKYLKVSCSISNATNNQNHINGRVVDSKPIYTGCFHTERQNQSHYFVDGLYIIAPYKTVEYRKGNRQVYNLSVAEDESYTANGLVVHNCTYWSIAQKQNRETEASGMGWELFSRYVKALNEAKPKYFIYENNKSMSSSIRGSISNAFGFEPIYINSSLVSAQHRQRLYWVGKRNNDGTYNKVDIQLPEDRGILLQDVLDSAFNRNKTSVVAPVNLVDGDKSFAIKANYYKSAFANFVNGGGHYPQSGVAEPVRVGTWPNKAKNQAHDSQQYRIYSVAASSVTLCGNGGGMGAKTGLYAVPIDIEDDISPDLVHETDGKPYPVYKVVNGEISINNKQYPIKLEDGYYIIRKLTVSECKRLQTVPDWYEFPVSDTQAYKMLGNGWTVSVIAHLLNSIKTTQQR